MEILRRRKSSGSSLDGSRSCTPTDADMHPPLATVTNCESESSSIFKSAREAIHTKYSAMWKKKPAAEAEASPPPPYKRDIKLLRAVSNCIKVKEGVKVELDKLNSQNCRIEVVECCDETLLLIGNRRIILTVKNNDEKNTGTVVWSQPLHNLESCTIPFDSKTKSTKRARLELSTQGGRFIRHASLPSAAACSRALHLIQERQFRCLESEEDALPAANTPHTPTSATRDNAERGSVQRSQYATPEGGHRRDHSNGSTGKPSLEGSFRRIKSSGSLKKAPQVADNADAGSAGAGHVRNLSSGSMASGSFKIINRSNSLKQSPQIATSDLLMAEASSGHRRNFSHGSDGIASRVKIGRRLVRTQSSEIARFRDHLNHAQLDNDDDSLWDDETVMSGFDQDEQDDDDCDIVDDASVAFLDSMIGNMAFELDNLMKESDAAEDIEPSSARGPEMTVPESDL